MSVLKRSGKHVYDITNEKKRRKNNGDALNENKLRELSLKCVYMLDRNVKFGKCSKFQTQDAYQKALTKSAVPDQNVSEIAILTEFVEFSAATCKQCFIRKQKLKSVRNGKFTAIRFTKSS